MIVVFASVPLRRLVELSGYDKTRGLLLMAGWFWRLFKGHKRAHSKDFKSSLAYYNTARHYEQIEPKTFAKEKSSR